MINICFHGIGRPQRQLEPDEDRYWITAEMFKWVLDEASGRDDIAISFDDGNCSDAEIGLPELIERSLRATFFILAGRLSTPGSLSGDDLLPLREAGMSIGSHGMDHVSWRGLSEPDQHRELVLARSILVEASSGSVTDAALPLGRYDRRLLKVLRSLDYRTIYSSDRVPARSRSWLQSRYSIRSDDTIESVRAILTGPHWTTSIKPRAKILLKRLR